MATTVNRFENISIATFNRIESDNWACFVTDIFSRAAQAGVNIDMITQSPGVTNLLSLAFTFKDEDMPKLLGLVNDAAGIKKNPPLVNVGNVKFIIKSPEMANNVGFAAKVFDSLKKFDCLPLLITTALDEISLLVSESCAADLEMELNEQLTAVDS
ncbi:MAG: aspartate kinase [Oscillospiraceae bacterium]|nr:aspartate kinase [Oscillospiraceae bacterium]